LGIYFIHWVAIEKMPIKSVGYKLSKVKSIPPHHILVNDFQCSGRLKNSDDSMIKPLFSIYGATLLQGFQYMVAQAAFVPNSSRLMR
jgi:hypothetical protein